MSFSYRFSLVALGLVLIAGCDNTPPIPPLPDTGPPRIDGGPDAGPVIDCDNELLDGDESSVDCGGSCEPCEPGSNCRGPEDCQSEVCSRGFCLVPTCRDGVRNGDEVGVDCGGSCGLCPGGQPCTTNGDCLSNRCMSGGVCAESTCEDGIHNADETDVDCGGSMCPSCEGGLMCERASDCDSGLCQEEVCTDASCSDRVQNQDETSIDCGGVTCPGCRDGLACGVDADCMGMRCVDGGCVSCTDRVHNAEETDVDCGGPLCGPCNDGKMCSVDTDCASNRCLSGVCVSCVDGVQNAEETDVDCGGGRCPACGNGLACLTGADCRSADCTGGICRGVADVCSDAWPLVEGPNVVTWSADGLEYLTSASVISCSSTAPDGPDLVMSYTPALTGFMAFSIDKPTSTRWHLVVSDGTCGTLTPERACISEFTAPTIGGEIPVTAGTTYYFYLVDSTSGTMPLSYPLDVAIEVEPAYCRDSTLNMDETDVDCGGPTCAPCLNGLTCSLDSDCLSNDCTGGICQGVGDTCADAVTLTTGSNVITWSAVGRDYLPAMTSCSFSYTVEVPDVVLSYTAPSAGTLGWSMPKPASTRWVAIVSTGACGTLTPEVTCTSDFSATALSGSFPVTAGTTYWFYVADTSSGTNPLSNPLTVDLTLTP